MNQPIPTSEEEWKKRLTPEQFRVLREKGTELPFSGKYYFENAQGMYVCGACGNPLFASENKFDAGCGWPSFDAPTRPGALKESTDTSHEMVRTEVTCSRCGSHLGHLFDDGPTSTGKRYCINSIALNQKPKTP